jgi:hypothetical protein
MRLVPLGACLFLLASLGGVSNASANPCAYDPHYASPPCVEEPYAPEPSYEPERHYQPCPFCGPSRPFYWQRSGCRQCDGYEERPVHVERAPCYRCEEPRYEPEPEPEPQPCDPCGRYDPPSPYPQHHRADYDRD